MLGAEGGDKLLVRLLLASFVEHADMGLATVERLGGLTETTSETIVDLAQLQDTLESIKKGEVAGAGVGSDLDFLSGSGGVGNSLFSVRLSRFFSVSRRIHRLQSGKREHTIFDG